MVVVPSVLQLPVPATSLIRQDRHIHSGVISSAPTLERGMDPELQRGALFLLRIIEIDRMGDGLALDGFAFYL